MMFHGWKICADTAENTCSKLATIMYWVVWNVMHSYSANLTGLRITLNVVNSCDSWYIKCLNKLLWHIDTVSMLFHHTTDLPKLNIPHQAKQDVKRWIMIRLNNVTFIAGSFVSLQYYINCMHFQYYWSLLLRKLKNINSRDASFPGPTKGGEKNHLSDQKMLSSASNVNLETYLVHVHHHRIEEGGSDTWSGSLP